MIKRKYAWIPKHVYTWRLKGTTAIIWLQTYYQYDNGKKYCNHLGFFSYEFYD